MNNRMQAILRQAGIADRFQWVPASGGQRNEVWTYGPYIVRMARRENQRSLVHEALLLQHLADTVPVPAIIAHGSDDGREWMIQEKIEGHSLAHEWATLSEQTRHRIVVQLAEIIQRVHQSSCGAVPVLRLSTTWLTSTLPTAVQQLAEQSKSFPYVDSGMMNSVITYVNDLDPTELGTSTWGIIHGDLHFDNILWDGQQITALLDFEKASYAPLDLELDLFLRYCAFPALFVAEEFEHLARRDDYRLAPSWLQQTYPQLFDAPFLYQRLGLYSLHYDLLLLQRFPPRSQVSLQEDDHLLNRIRAIIEGTGYLC